jgi:hypothetical protein
MNEKWNLNFKFEHLVSDPRLSVLIRGKFLTFF